MKYYRIKVCGLWAEGVFIKYSSEEVGEGYATPDLFTFAHKSMAQEVE